jgi:hypothetical protein
MNTVKMKLINTSCRAPKLKFPSKLNFYLICLFFCDYNTSYTGQLKKKVTLSHVVYTRQYAERLLLWSRHFATRFHLAAARKTFPRQLQTNFESFPNNCRISSDCRLTGYFIINVLKCCLLFELPCI